VLQGLAEAAARAERPFLILTILHQSLDRYTEHVSPARRAEWAKVQGRFVDVAFEERTEQIVRLLGRAIRYSGPDAVRRSLETHGGELAAEACELGIKVGSLAEDELRSTLAAAYPLHPLTAVAVGPLFRQLAQNERSLFAFLTAHEPFGFQEFLRHQTGCEAYRLDRLYDYATTVVGPALFAQQRGKYWAEVQSVLERLQSGDELERRVAKVIGLLQALGAGAAPPACRQVVRFALRGPDVADADIATALDGLVRRSLVVFRRHTASYALWEGSDIDIEGQLGEARRAIDPKRGLASLLARQGALRPLVARRHYYQTGTLRYFDACYATGEELEPALHRDFGEADGRIIYCLPLTAEDWQRMEAHLRSPLENVSPAVVAALPHEVSELGEWCHEVASLQWVLQNTPELATDRVARREVRSRLAHAESGLRSYLQAAFRPGEGEEDRCLWLHDGKDIQLASTRQLNDFLSHVCDNVYSHTPVWRNELLNRRSLSSSAAAARRNLIEAMIERGGEEALGIKGTPPERSMYESVLRASGLHRKQAGNWGFHPPTPKAGRALTGLWEAVRNFLDETEAARQPIGRLFATLGRPPFGVKDGVLPVLLAAVLLHYHAEVALYEEGTFVPRLSPPIFERVLRAPQKFEVQRCRITGARGTVLQRYAALLGQRPTAGGPPRLLDVVRPLARLVRGLPEYVYKTRQLSPVAQAVLRAVREARQPDRLLFADLPAACGLPPFTGEGRSARDAVDGFFEALQGALGELQQAYPALLADIERLILKAFDHNGPLPDARAHLTHQARLVLNMAIDAKLKSFLIRMADPAPDDPTWLESLASLLGGRPPATWDDQDRARFEVQLAAAARTFRHFQVLAFEMNRAGAALLDGDAHALRVSITVPDGPEVERVVQVPARLRDSLEQAREEVRRALASAELLDDPNAAVAFLAQMVRELLAEPDTKDPGSP
jgi:hypothetical protein